MARARATRAVVEKAFPESAQRIITDNNNNNNDDDDDDDMNEVYASAEEIWQQAPEKYQFSAHTKTLSKTDARCEKTTTDEDRNQIDNPISELNRIE